jgi:hypothetical protein
MQGGAVPGEGHTFRVSLPKALRKHGLMFLVMVFPLVAGDGPIRVVGAAGAVMMALAIGNACLVRVHIAGDSVVVRTIRGTSSFQRGNAVATHTTMRLFWHDIEHVDLRSASNRAYVPLGYFSPRDQVVVKHGILRTLSSPAERQ